MILHVVRIGETMLSIANEYQVSETRLRSDNGMSQTQTPCVGQALLVLYPERTYTVKEGDTPLSIASIKTTMDRYVHVTDESMTKAVQQFEKLFA